MAAMTRAAKVLWTGLALLGSLWLTGCLPASTSSLDEEKEPHFVTGMRRSSEMDYKGAVEEFERTLQSNPAHALAHFELGVLFENDRGENDPAAAIYHFEQYLKLRPKADNAEIVQQHILACKQELARTVSLGPIAEKQQRAVEQLTQENQRLREEVEKWRAYYSGRAPATNPAVLPLESVRGSPPNRGSAQTLSAVPGPNQALTNRPVSARSHIVQAGETPSRIARQYGLKVEALMAANPGLDPRRLLPGQTLNIPAQ